MDVIKTQNLWLASKFLICYLLMNGCLLAQDVSFAPNHFNLEVSEEESNDGFSKKFGFELTNNRDTILEWYWNIELADNFPTEWK